jgi:CBS domain-containing protein
MARSIEEILQDVRIDEVELRPAVRMAPESPLAEVYAALEASPHGAVLICEGDAALGIFTERDVLYRTALEEIAPETPVADLMTREPVSLEPGARLAEAVALMTQRGYRHIALVDGTGRCVGLLASRDVLRFIADHFPEAVLNLPPHLHQTIPTPEGA